MRKSQNNNTNFVFYYFVFAPFIFTTVLMRFLPDYVPMHSDFWGNIDKWWSKEYQLLIAGVYSLIILLFVLIINKKDIGNIGYMLCITIILFQYFKYLWELLGIVYLPSGAINMYSFEWNFHRIFVGILIVIYTLCGLFIHKIKHNCIIGLRTYWIIQSDEVWDYIHQSFRIWFLIISGILFLILSNPLITDIVKTILSSMITILLIAYLVYKSYERYKVLTK